MKTKIIGNQKIESLDDLLELLDKKKIERCPVDLRAVAKCLGVNVVYRKLNMSNINCMLEETQDENGKKTAWTITIDKGYLPKYSRLCLAHMLGHYVYHRKYQKVFKEWIEYPDQSQRESLKLVKLREAQVERFVGNLLMPEDRFNKLIYRENMTNIKSLARYFRVSCYTLVWRACCLGMGVGFKTLEI
jgi:Zn-dependent peptidase ImmA (M78 family)